MKQCKCGEQVSEKRWNLGYRFCFSCGEKKAKDAIEKRSKTVIPSYHKGGLQPAPPESVKERLKELNKVVPVEYMLNTNVSMKAKTTFQKRRAIGFKRVNGELQIILEPLPFKKVKTEYD